MAQLGTAARPLRVVRELGWLKGVDLAVDPADIELDEASRAGMEEDRTAKANLRQLQEYAARPRGRPRAAPPCGSWPRRSRC